MATIALQKTVQGCRKRHKGGSNGLAGGTIQEE